MASELVLRIGSDKTLTQLKLDLLKASGDRYGQAVLLKNLMQAAMAGTENVTITMEVDPVKATGTATCVSVIATDTIVVDGISFAAVASGATGNQFNVGGTNTITATNIAAALNANTTLDGRITATSALNVVTITADNYGEDGNSISLTAGGGTITLSAAALAGGDNGTDRANAFGR